MGVCPLQHHICTGLYNSRLILLSASKCGKLYFVPCKRGNVLNNFLCVKSVLLSTLSAAGLILYVYILCLVMAIWMEISLKQNTSLHFIETTFKQHHKLSHPTSETCSTVINNYFLILILHLLKTTPLKQVKTVFV